MAAQPSRRPRPCQSTHHPLDRVSDEIAIAVFARVPFTSHGTLRVVCRRLNTLVSSAAFLEERREAGCLEWGVVVAGGVRCRTRSEVGRDVAVTTSSYSWLLSGEQWVPIASMSGGPRHAACSTVIDNELWVVGGFNEEGRTLASVEVYSPRTNTWRSLRSDMNQARSSAVCGLDCSGSLIVAGGYRCGYIMSAESYTAEAGWTSLPDLPRTAWNAVACVLNGRLFVAGAGGSGGSKQLLMWDGTAWQARADLPTGRSLAASVATADGKMMVIGGRVGGQATASVIIYNPQSDSWAEGVPLPEPRQKCAAVLLPHTGSIVLIGGGGPALSFKGGAWAEIASGCARGAASSMASAASAGVRAPLHRSTRHAVAAAAAAATAAIRATPPSEGILISHMAGSVLLG